MLNLNDWLDEKEPSKIINAENIAFPKCKNFGIGYQGSKNRLAKEIISFCQVLIILLIYLLVVVL